MRFFAFSAFHLNTVFFLFSVVVSGFCVFFSLAYFFSPYNFAFPRFLPVVFLIPFFSPLFSTSDTTGFFFYFCFIDRQLGCVVFLLSLRVFSLSYWTDFFIFLLLCVCGAR